MIPHSLAILSHEIAEFCRRNHITRLATFGSILRKDFSKDRDIDLLVEFEAGHVPGLRFFALQDELSEMFGRRVDLNTPKFLSHFFRDEVAAKAVSYYDARLSEPSNAIQPPQRGLYTLLSGGISPSSKIAPFIHPRSIDPTSEASRKA